MVHYHDTCVTVQLLNFDGATTLFSVELKSLLIGIHSQQAFFYFSLLSYHVIAMLKFMMLQLHKDTSLQ